MTVKRIMNLFLFIVVGLAVGWLGSIATNTSIETWYAALQKPSLNPPNWVFGPVWTTLYIFMSIAGWLIWETENSKKNRLRVLFVAQLILNGVWSFLFFGLRNPFISLMDIVFLLACLSILTLEAWKTKRIAGALLFPYLIWVGFATYLNAALWWLNR